MKGSDLKKMVNEAIKASLTQHDPSSHTELAPTDRDEMDDVDDLLISVGNKLRSARDSGVDADILAEAVEHIEEADRILSGLAMSEGFGDSDRHVLVGQVQALGKKIATKAAMSSLPDGALSAMIANLTSIANKL
jgi:hypothetical protein